MTLDFEAFFMHSSECMAILKPDSFLVATNPALRRQLGYTQEKLSKTLFTSLIHPEDVTIFLDAFHAAIQNATAFKDIMIRMRAKGRVYKALTWSGMPTKDGYIYLTACIENGASAENDTSKVHQPGQKYLTQAVVHNTFGGLIFQDTSGKITYTNQKALDLLETTKSRLIGHTNHDLAWEFIYPDGSIYPVTAYPPEVALKTGKNVQLQTMGVKLSPKKIKWLSVSTELARDEFGIISGVVVFFFDQTQVVEIQKKYEINAQRLEYALQGSRDGLWDWNLQTSEVYFSPSWKAMLGFKDSEIQGSRKEWTRRVHPDDLAKTEALIQEHLKGKKPYYESEHRVLCKDGTYKWILDRGRITTYDKRGKPLRIVGTHVDITERKKYEAQLLELSTRYQLAIGAGRIGLWDLTIKDSILTWNEQMYALYGIKQRQFDGRLTSWKKMIHPEDRKNVEASLKTILKDSNPMDISFRIIWPDKTIHYIHQIAIVSRDESGRISRIVGVNLDMTKQYEDLRSIERFKMAVDAAYDHVVITDVDGIILYANHAAEHNTGFLREEMYGHTPRLWGRQMPPGFYKKMWHTIKVKKEPFVGEIKNKRKDGVFYIAEAHVSPILDDSGKPTYFLGIERDITKVKEVDAAKSEFVSLASHQLRTPLSAINWYAELLTSGDAGKLDEQQTQFVNQIYSSSQRMVELIRSLLNVSRIDLGTLGFEPKKVDVITILNGVVSEQTKNISENKINLVTEIPKKCVLEADERALQMVLQNLISNAIKYTPAKGKVTIKMDVLPPGQHTFGKVSRKFNEKCLMIEVSDTGIGIPYSAQSRMFTKLYRADNAQTKIADGNGLGLYIVKAIINQLGGDIFFESKLNKGTTFYCYMTISGLRKKGTGIKILDV